MSKKMLLASVPLLATCALAPSAYAKDGVYYGGLLGLGLMPNQKFEVNNSNRAIPSFKLKYDPGFALGADIGYQQSYFRYEGEIAFMRNKINTLTRYGQDYSSSGFGVYLDNTMLMANGYFDIPVAKSPVKPYIGAGIGFGNYTIDFDDSDTTYSISHEVHFTYQGIVGAAYQINPKTRLTLDYRYIASTHFKDIDTGYQNHTINLGIIYQPNA